MAPTIVTTIYAFGYLLTISVTYPEPGLKNELWMFARATAWPFYWTYKICGMKLERIGWLIATLALLSMTIFMWVRKPVCPECKPCDETDKIVQELAVENDHLRYMNSLKDKAIAAAEEKEQKPKIQKVTVTNTIAVPDTAFAQARIAEVQGKLDVALEDVKVYQHILASYDLALADLPAEVEEVSEFVKYHGFEMGKDYTMNWMVETEGEMYGSDFEVHVRPKRNILGVRAGIWNDFESGQAFVPMTVFYGRDGVSVGAGFDMTGKPRFYLEAGFYVKF